LETDATAPLAFNVDAATSDGAEVACQELPQPAVWWSICQQRLLDDHLNDQREIKNPIPPAMLPRPILQ